MTGERVQLSLYGSGLIAAIVSGTVAIKVGGRGGLATPAHTMVRAGLLNST